MGISVGVNPPKTPVTEKSSDVAPATLPNVCKMPGTPFTPTPLPNIGRSSDSLTDGTTTVKIESKKVAIKGSYYMSKGSPDKASQGTGGGLISSKVEGKTEFVAPGSINVKAEGKNIQILGDAMTNNGGSPANSATIPGNIQPPQTPSVHEIECTGKTHPAKGGEPWSECDYKQFCAKIEEVKKQMEPDSGAIEPGYEFKRGASKKARREGNAAAADFREEWNTNQSGMSEDQKKADFYDDCAYEEADNGADVTKFSPDHVHEIQLGGSILGPFKWCKSYVNESLGGHMRAVKPDQHTSISADCC